MGPVFVLFYSATTYLLIGALSSFTFKVILYRYILRATFICFLVVFVVLLHSFSSSIEFMI